MHEQLGEKPKLLFLDDHRVILDGISQLTAGAYQMMGVASVHEFESALDSFNPELAVVDIQLTDEDGFDVARRALARKPGLKIAFLSAHADSRMLRRAAELGAAGYMSKRSSGDELLLGIRTMLNGGKYVSPRAAEASEVPEAPLTERQKQVLRLIALGFSAKEIATELNISVRTAEFHRAEIMERLKLHSTALMTRYAIAHGIA
jgi:DNA-binding NarL/FixJ family response regulator